MGIHRESTFKRLFRCAGFTNNFGHFSEGGFPVDSRWIPKKQTLTVHTVYSENLSIANCCSFYLKTIRNVITRHSSPWSRVQTLLKWNQDQVEPNTVLFSHVLLSSCNLEPWSKENKKWEKVFTVQLNLILKDDSL